MSDEDNVSKDNRDSVKISFENSMEQSAPETLAPNYAREENPV